MTWDPLVSRSGEAHRAFCPLARKLFMAAPMTPWDSPRHKEGGRGIDPVRHRAHLRGIKPPLSCLRLPPALGSERAVANK